MLRWLLALVLLPSLSSAATIAIVKSDTLAPYAQVIASFASVSGDELVEYDLKGDEARAKQAFAHLKAHRPALVWALGPMAATLARRELPDVPMLFSMVPDHERYELSGAKVWGISLSRSPRSRLESLVGLMPTAQKVGVVYDPRHAAAFVKQAQRAAVELGLEFVAVPVGDVAEADARLDTLSGRVDVIWMVPDVTTSAPEVFKRVEVFARGSQVPLVALSEAQVRAGALLSFSPEVVAMGRQAATVAQRLVHDEKAAARQPRVVEPEALRLFLNLTVARSLPKGRDLAIDAFTWAAGNDFPVTVIE